MAGHVEDSMDLLHRCALVVLLSFCSESAIAQEAPLKVIEHAQPHWNVKSAGVAAAPLRRFVIAAKAPAELGVSGQAEAGLPRWTRAVARNPAVTT
jgi:hypothetical protein